MNLVVLIIIARPSCQEFQSISQVD